MTDNELYELLRKTRKSVIDALGKVYTPDVIEKRLTAVNRAVAAAKEDRRGL